MTGVVSNAGRQLLALSLVRGIGPAKLRQLAADPRFPSTALEAEALGRLVPAVAPPLAAADLGEVWQKAQDQVDRARDDGARILTLLDAAYPELLKSVRDAPAVLFVRGALRPGRTVAVIGTRQPTPHGAEIARRATRHFAERGWSVVSGLALGVDALAHRAALEVGGHTVAVLAHGLHTVAPRGHQDLAAQIVAAGGALLSEYGYGQDPRPEYFVQRDRIQAGLAQGVLMVQSDREGGSLHASRASLRYSRPLAVPVPTARDQAAREPKVQGNLALLGPTPGAAELLKCREEELRLLIPLPSREAYAVFEEAMDGTGQADTRASGRLL